ncbi:hypothetical protein IAQ61_003394 [Plenodomus lingam]|uniref:uncharacterized protein n=1 Tax=Leptosphaeria maculans TaxID=5022 RepID=UPI0033192037|nr:hypothetical protein IAQ61_003394 [Plenodomus lingam]
MPKADHRFDFAIQHAQTPVALRVSCRAPVNVICSPKLMASAEGLNWHGRSLMAPLIPHNWATLFLAIKQRQV